MLRLERVQYRGIRLALGLISTSPNNSLGVLSGMSLETLGELNLSRYISGHSDVLPLNVVSSESFTRHNLPALLAAHFVGDHMQGAFSGVQTSMYLVVALRELVDGDS
jgi:hypothetical protein